MTTIAASVVHNSLACDLQFTYEGQTKFKGKTKVLSLDGKICEDIFNTKQVHIGFSGNADKWGQVINWFSDPTQKQPKCTGIEFLMLNDKKQIFHATNLTNWMLVSEKHFAIGSGMQFALAAMTAGQTPLDACKIASKHDLKTGLGFQSFTFG